MRSTPCATISARGYGSPRARGRRDVSPHSRDTMRPRFCKIFRPENRGRRRPSREGAGKTGCALHPRSHVRRAQKNAHEHTGSAESIRPSLRNGFNAYIVLSPASRAFLPPSLADCSANLTPASGCQDHTILPSASLPFVKSSFASIASRAQRS